MMRIDMDRRSFIGGLAAAAAISTAPATAETLPVWRPDRPMRSFWEPIEQAAADLPPVSIAETHLHRLMEDAMERVTGLRPPFVIRRERGDLTIRGIGHHPNMVVLLDGAAAHRWPAVMVEIDRNVLSEGERLYYHAICINNRAPGRHMVTREGVIYFDAADGYYSSLHLPLLKLRQELGMPIQIKDKGDKVFWIESDHPLIRESIHSMLDERGIQVTVFRESEARLYAVGGEFRWRPSPFPANVEVPAA